MFARNSKLVVPLFLSALISCSQQEDFFSNDDVANGTEISTTVSVKVPDVFISRAVPNVYESGTTYFGESGMPSIGNVDLLGNPLTFTVGVYIEKSVGETNTYTLVDKQSRKNESNAEAYFNFRLLKGERYRLVAYADFDGIPKENLDSIPFATTLNNELSDAFFATQEFTAQKQIEVILKRPFGKLRLIARDFNTFAKGEKFKITGVKVNYKRQPMLATNVFNAITGEFNYKEDAKGDTMMTAAPAVYAQEYSEADTAAYAAVFTMYLPANFGTPLADDSYADGVVVDGTPIPQSWMYPFDVTVTYQNVQDSKIDSIVRSFDIDIPVKRNWLTTIDATNFWADNSNIKVTIDHRFEGFIDKKPGEYKVYSDVQLQEAIDQILATSTGYQNVGNIVLGSDIEMKNMSGFVFNKYMGGEIHLDLNGYKITADGSRFDKDADGYTKSGGIFGIRNAYCTLVIDDSSKDATGTIEFTGEGAYVYPIIYCFNGGRVIINGGRFINRKDSPAVYVYQQESYHASIYRRGYKTYPTDETKRKRFIYVLSTFATINGGWFQNGDGLTVVDGKNECTAINAYNNVTSKWNDRSAELEAAGYPGWGPHVDSTFGYVYINGGSFVEFNPALGDNICGNYLNDWVDNKHAVEFETIDGRTVYTVIPNVVPGDI